MGLHGWAGSAETFVRVALHCEAPVLALDLPGAGDSPPPRRWTLEEVADQVNASVAAMTQRPVALWGNCSGGLVALVAAERAPHLYTQLVLIESYASVPNGLRPFLWPLVGPLFFWVTFKTPVGRALLNWALRKHRQPGTDLAEDMARMPTRQALAMLRMFATLEGDRRFHALGLPVRIILGEDTMAEVRDAVSVWRSMWPEAQVHTVPRAGHFLLQEQPQSAAIALQPHPSAVEPDARGSE